MNYTPENITELQPNEVFVFGSNANGNHAGGAARVAVEKFGAIMGQAEGLQGQSYAIPTLDKDMQKMDLDTLQQSLNQFCWVAEENKEKTFYLTKIGMGIAGFTLEEMLSVINRVDIPSNVVIPKEFDVVYSYKGFDKDLKCRDYQFEVGKEYEADGPIQCCKNGFHACKSPMEIWDHYDMLTSRYCQVEQSGDIDRESNTTKVCSSKIKIKAELKLADIIKLGVEWLIDKTSLKHLKATKNNSGDSAQIGSSGDSAQIGSSGDSAQIGSSGDSAKIGSSGDSAQIGSSGDSAKIGSSGDSAKIGSSGDSAQIGSSGDSAKIGSSGDSAQIGSSGDSAKIGSSGDSAQIGSSGYYAKIGSSGYSAQIGSSGDYAKIGSSGDSAKIGSSGDSAQIGSSGYYAKIGSSGYYAQIGSSGDYAKIGSSGYYAQIGSSGDSAKIGSSGDSAQIGSSGDSAQIGSSGDSAKIGSSGYYAKIGSSGYYAQIGSSGDYAKIGSSGDYAKIGSSGDYAQIGSSGYSAQIDSTGADSVICCAGRNSTAKAKIGSWITLSEWVYSDEKKRYIPKCVKTEYVDGERVKEDTWYKLVNGEFIEVE